MPDERCTLKTQDKKQAPPPPPTTTTTNNNNNGGQTIHECLSGSQ
jgi:hypothetical protein